MVMYIARHGESLGNTGEDTGHNPALSEKGQIQAELLGKRMKNVKLDCIMSSPLKRAVQTAEKTAELQNRQVEIIETAYEVENETTEDAYIRAKNVIETIKNRFRADERVIIFAHGTFNNYLTNAAIGFPVRDDFNFCQENTGLTCIKFLLDGKTKIEFANDYCHLAPFGEIEY